MAAVPATHSLRHALLLAAPALVASAASPRCGLSQATSAPATVAAVVPADSARPIALDEAVRLAQRRSPLAVQARGSERTARAGVRSAYAAFLPNLTVSLGSTRQFTSGQATRIGQNGEVVTVAQNPWTYNSGLTFGVDLFDGGRRLYDISASRADVGAAEANTVGQRYRIALDVAQQYFNALAARESESAAQAQLQQAQQQLRAAITRVAAGAATKSDSLRSVIAVGNATLALLTARNNLNVANAGLTRLIGSDELVTATESDSAATTLAAPLDTAQLFQLAEDGPAIRQAEASLGAARANRRAARAPYLPTISASYSRSGSGIDSRYGLGGDPYNYNGALRFGLSYPLFNQLNREEQVVRADVAEDNAQAALRDTRLQARQNLVQYLGALRTAQQRIAIQVASVAAAEEDLRVQQQRYQLGASTLLDVLTSQTQLDQARAQLIQARYDYRVARAQIEAVIGRQL